MGILNLVKLAVKITHHKVLRYTQLNFLLLCSYGPSP